MEDEDNLNLYDNYVEEEESFEIIEEDKKPVKTKHDFYDLLTIKDKEKKLYYESLFPEEDNVKKNYYKEKRTTQMILDYQKTITWDETGKIIVDCDRELEGMILIELKKVALAIINKYSYWRFMEYDELMQECMKEAFKNIPKFNPEYIVDENTKRKATSFNYFSIIFKIHLRAVTKKDQKNREIADIDIQPDIENRKELNYDLFFEDLDKAFQKIINENFIRAKRKKYLELAAIIMEYMEGAKVFVGKNDMLAFVRGFGFKSSDYKEFVEALSPYKNELYGIV